MLSQLSRNAEHLWKPIEIDLVHANVLKPQWPAVLTVKKLFAIGELTCDTALAFWIIGAIEEGNVLVADVAEPVDLVLILEETKCNAMHRRVAPALVEKAAGAI